MADVLVTRGSDTWVWRFPGSDEELVAAVAAGCFPPAGDYEGTASKVDRAPILDRLVDIGEDGSTLYIDDEDWEGPGQALEPPAPRPPPLPLNVKVDRDPNPTVVRILPGPPVTLADLEPRLDLSGLMELHLTTSGVPDASIVPLVTHLQAHYLPVLGNHTWPRLVDLSLVCVGSATVTPTLPALQSARLLPLVLYAKAGFDDDGTEAAAALRAETLAALHSIVPSCDASGLEVRVYDPSDAERARHEARRARLDPDRVSGLLDEVLRAGDLVGVLRSRAWASLGGEEEDVQDTVGVLALERFLDDPDAPTADLLRQVAERSWRGPYPGEPMSTASVALLPRVEALEPARQGSLPARLRWVVANVGRRTPPLEGYARPRPHDPERAPSTATVERVRGPLAAHGPVQGLHVLLDA
ncbi:MAG: hypothetical protein KC656_28515, partial [Myxococcales bacterium]|nr:hypothetical protein [Myxococcales bacterium]